MREEERKSSKTCAAGAREGKALGGMKFRTAVEDSKEKKTGN